MQEKGIPSQPITIYHRLITFILNSLIARSLAKRVTLGHPIPQDLQPVISANPNGEDQTVHLQALQTPENESVFEIQIHYKQTDEDFEEYSWTQVDKLGLIIERTEEAEIQDKGPPEVKLISTATSQAKEPKRILSIEDLGELEKEKNNKKKGKGVIISGEKLTLAIAAEDNISKPGLRGARPLFHVAPNINEKSDAFIRSRKEAMRRNYGLDLEPRVS